MRIALVHYRVASSGGMERYLLDLARGFASRGDDVDLWVHSANPELVHCVACPVRLVARLPTPRLMRNVYFSWAVARKRLRSIYGLVISLARTTGQDVYVSGGTHAGFLQSMEKCPTLKDHIDLRLERAALRSSALVIAHSQRIRTEYLELYGIDEAKVHVVYPPVDKRRFVRSSEHQRKETRRSLGLDQGQFLFLFPSMGHERKGLPTLLEAFRKLPSERSVLYVAGRVLPPTGDARVRALGYVRDMAALYSAADCTVLPSRYEPFGLAIAESLQCGTPVITAADSGVAELMSVSDGIRLPRCDVADVRKALETVMRERAQVEPDFAGRHGLTIDKHVTCIKHLCGHSKGQHIGS